MLRSFSYAAFAGHEQFRSAHPDRSAAAENLAGWARAWETAVTSEFLRAYRSTMAADPSLLPPEADANRILSAHLLEKALYELLYELNNRPGWLRIPLSGILSL